MKKWLMILLCLMLCMPCALAEDEPIIYESGCFRYIVSWDGTAVIVGLSDAYHSESDLTVPGYLDGYAVTYIGSGAFANCFNLTSVKLPNHLLGIGDSAFFTCVNLVDIKLPNSITSIGMDAFRWCASLKNLALPASIDMFGLDAFADCEKLTLRVVRGSYAEEYCRDNGLNYRY